MGRSPLFNIDNIEVPPHHTDSSEIIKTLQPGQRVKLSIATPLPYGNYVCRSPSTYGKSTSSINMIELVVDNIDIDLDLTKHGIKTLALRDPMILKEDHMYTWYVTTDGYVRESEHYGIIYKIVSVIVIE